MAITFDKALGNQEAALTLRVKRSEVLSNNMANAETPGFQAVDFNFSTVYDRARTGGNAVRSFSTDPRHMSVETTSKDGLKAGDMEFRKAKLGSLDGSSVSLEQERARFMENQIRLNASNMFLSKRFSSMTKALKGGQG